MCSVYLKKTTEQLVQHLFVDLRQESFALFTYMISAKQ
jgi:hypothetical protein